MIDPRRRLAARALHAARMLERRAKIRGAAIAAEIAEQERKRHAAIAAAHGTRRAFLGSTRWAAFACVSSELTVVAAAIAAEAFASHVRRLLTEAGDAQLERLRWAQIRRALERRQERAQSAAGAWRA